MRLEPAGREFYKLDITTEPAVTAWEASFDGGTTWQPSTDVGGLSAWLIAGPGAEVGTAVHVAPLGRTVPTLRAVDNPEIIIRDGPPIDVA